MSDDLVWTRAVIVGFLLAPFTGTVVLGALAMLATGTTAGVGEALGFVILVALFGAYPIALMLGIPAYLMVRDLKVDLIGAAFIGAAITLAPFAAVAIVQAGAPLRDDGSAMAFAGMLVASGAAGGAVFWALTFRRRPVRQRLARQRPAPKAVPRPRAARGRDVGPWRLTS